MKTIYTDIEIRASAEQVWQRLTDFASYPQWNPFIKSIEGKAEVGARLTVRIEPQGGRAMTFHSTVLAADPAQELRWLGRVFMRGLFAGEHKFRIEPLGAGQAWLIQRENFKGMLVPLIWRSMEGPTRRGFEQMNEALKKSVEGGSAARVARNVVA